MSEAKSISAPAIDLTDESFDPKKSNTYHLSVLVDQHSLSYAVLDLNSNKYLVLNSGDASFPIKSLKKMGITFKSVTCAVAHPKFTVVPAALFDEENKNSLLGFNHVIEASEKTHSDLLQNLGARNLFTISRELETSIRAQFPSAHILHNSTVLIETLLLQNKNKKDKKVFADLHDGFFYLIILEGSELIFSNAFNYSNPEELAYYVLFVYEQLHLNPEEVELTLSGSIDKTAKEHALLFTYIRHVHFARLPENFKYSYKFEEVPSHRYWSLFSQFLCLR